MNKLTLNEQAINSQTSIADIVFASYLMQLSFQELRSVSKDVKQCRFHLGLHLVSPHFMEVLKPLLLILKRYEK